MIGKRLEWEDIQVGDVLTADALHILCVEIVEKTTCDIWYVCHYLDCNHSHVTYSNLEAFMERTDRILMDRLEPCSLSEQSPMTRKRHLIERR